MDVEEVFKKYRKGLKELLLLLKDHQDVFEKFENLQQQLIENIESAETFGDNDSLKQSRKPILEKLNSIAYEKLSRSFNKIAGLTEVDINDYRQDFREKVFQLYRSLGFEIIPDTSNDEMRVDFVIRYTMPMRKAYNCMVKTIVSVEDIINEASIARFVSALEKARQEGVASTGEVITDLGFSPEAQQLARQHNILLLTYDECIQTLINFDKYIDQFICDYEHFDEFKEGTRQSFLDILENCDLFQGYLNPRFSDRNGIVYHSFDAYIENWLQNESEHELLILSEPGYGKTSLLLHLTYELAKKYKKNPAQNRIPILLPLINSGKAFNRRQIITDLLVNRYNLNFSNYATFEMLLKNQKLVLLLDGIDEISLDKNVYLASENFNEINKLMVNGGKAILTSDTNFLLSQRFAERIFSPVENKTPSKYLPKFEVLFLQELNGKQISDFLKLRTQNWQAFYIKIKSIPELLELAENPIVLDMMWRTLVQLIREKKPFTVSSFYEVYTSSWFEKEDEDSIMPAEDKAFFVEEMALEMLRREQLFLHNTEIPDSIRELFKDFLLEYREAEVFAYDVGTCPFIVEDLHGNYKFKHKSFIDFFVARKYIKCLKSGEMHDFNNVILPFEVKNFIVELMPKKYKKEEDILNNMSKIPSGRSTRPFWLDKYPVTNATYAKFIKSTGFEPPRHWSQGIIPAGKKNHPVTNISWHDAVLYAKWVGKRLPTEKEWEKAAGLEDGRKYPWGNEFKKDVCNSIESGNFNTTPINACEENISICGCFDMAGNVWEWTGSWVDEKRKDKGYVAKGGSFLSDATGVLSKNGLNYRELSIDIDESIGFRCAL